MTEARPYRPARPPAEVAAELRGQADQGRLDGATVDAVLAAVLPGRAGTFVTWA